MSIAAQLLPLDPHRPKAPSPVPTPHRRMGQHRSKIASTILPAGARWAAIAAAAMCAVLALPACATTHLLQVLPFLALPIAVAAAFQLALAFDFAIGKQAVGRSLPAPISVAAIRGLLWTASCSAASASLADASHGAPKRSCSNTSRRHGRSLDIRFAARSDMVRAR